MTKSIAFLGGTFDPVHNGHLHLATTLLEKLRFDELRFIPLNLPPHKAPPLASPEERLAMLEIATQGHARLIVDDCEIQRGGLSYTIDTLKLLQEASRTSLLCMIIGADQFKTLDQWQKWQSFLDYAHIIIVSRPHNNKQISPTLSNFMRGNMVDSAAQLRQHNSGYIIKLAYPMLDISSTKIRENLQYGKKTETFLPDKVLRFIHANNLYSNGTGKTN